VEILADDGTNIPQHFKAIGFVNGLEKAIKEILDEKITYYQQKTKEDYAEKPIDSIESGG